MTFKTMKGGKTGPEKYYYFLIPKLSGRFSVFDNMPEAKMTGNKNNWTNRKET